MVMNLKIIVYFIEGCLRLVLVTGCLLLSLKGSLKSVTPKLRSSEIKTICKLRFGFRNNFIIMSINHINNNVKLQIYVDQTALNQSIGM